MNQIPTMTTSSGAPVADNQNSLTAGPFGPVLMQDFHLLEKLAHLNRERIPERTVHAKGSGAYGTLTVTTISLGTPGLTRCPRSGRKTEAFLRLSTVAGERGAADAGRDVRGFALRFYTEDAYCEPNSSNGPVQDPSVKEPPLKLTGDTDRYNHREGNDDYRQVGNLFRLMTPAQKEQLFDNIKAALDRVPMEIVKRQVVHFYRADPNYGIGVATRMGLAASELSASQAAE